MTKLAIALVIVLSLGAYAYCETSPKADAAATDDTAAKTAAEERPSDSARAAAEPGKPKSTKDEAAAEDPDKVDWSQVDWRKRLTRLQYHIMREAGTERAFTGKYWDFFKPGQYRCAGCGQALFESEAKFESECGWPSFDRTITGDAVTEQVDHKIGYPRTEIRCSRCDAHLGHVFNDGPTETGQRYCLNSAAMKFMNEKQLKVEQEKTAKKAESKKDDRPQPAAASPAAAAPQETAQQPTAPQ